MISPVPCGVLFLAIMAAASAAAQTPSASPMQRFEGRFVGGGTLERGGRGATALHCELTGRSAGANLTLGGTCRANIIAGAAVSIVLRCSGASCAGMFRDGLGTVSSLSGRHRGDRFTLLAKETAESVRPDPPARMILVRDAEGIDLSVRNTQPGKGSTILLDLKKQ